MGRDRSDVYYGDASPVFAELFDAALLSAWVDLGGSEIEIDLNLQQIL